MKKLSVVFISISLLALPLFALADHDKENPGRRQQPHSKRDRPGHLAHSVKKSVWDGNCRLTLRYTRHGVFEEDRRCPRQPTPDNSAGYGPALRLATDSIPAVHPDDVTVLGTMSLP